MTMRGLSEWMVAIDGLIEGADAAARLSLRQGARAEKELIRKRMEGPPRWDASRHHRTEQSGGPGKITGRLQRSVGYSAITKVGYGHYMTRISAKRRYAVKTEDRYPYFTPGHREARPVHQQIFERNMLRAIV